MAESNDTIDPNDLDSIDALLDEAELEAISNDDDQGGETEADQPEADTPLEEGSLDDFPKEEEPEPEPEQVPEPEPESEPEPEPEPVVEKMPDVGGGIMDNFPSPDDEAESEPQPAAQPEPEPALEPMFKDESVAEASGANINDEPPAPASIVEDGAENFLQKRAALQQQNQSQNQNQNTLTVAEMDSIKKLIIIFSSITITLVLVAIGTGIWAALASNPGLDEEAKSLLEDIQAGSTQSMIKSSSSEKTVKELEKKLDALSFQIEQLNRDLIQMTPSQGADTVADVSIDGNKDSQKTDKKDSAVAVIPQPSQPVSVPQNIQVSAMDPELAKKMDKVSSRMVVTQRRVNEINNRIKSLQSQYKSILRTVKKVEQGMLEEQVKVAEDQKKAEELEKSQLAKQKQRAMEKARAYEYSAPNNPYFDSYQ